MPNSLKFFKLIPLIFQVKINRVLSIRTCVSCCVTFSMVQLVDLGFFSRLHSTLTDVMGNASQLNSRHLNSLLIPAKPYLSCFAACPDLESTNLQGGNMRV